MLRYELHAYYPANGKVEVFEAQSDLYAIAEADNFLKRGDFASLKHASLSKSHDGQIEVVATFRLVRNSWKLIWLNVQ